MYECPLKGSNTHGSRIFLIQLIVCTQWPFEAGEWNGALGSLKEEGVAIATTHREAAKFLLLVTIRNCFKSLGQTVF